MNKTTKNILWGVALLLIPGSGLMVGTFFIYKGARRYVQKRRHERLIHNYVKSEKAA